MHRILHLIFFTFFFNGCGTEFNIDEKSDRRLLRQKNSENATPQKGSSPDKTSGSKIETAKTPTAPNDEEDKEDDELVEEEQTTEPVLDPAAQGDPNIVVFRISAGTGRGSWNNEGTMIRATVGQTIRFVNDDTIRHRLHTNGAPCGHGPDFQPGETFDCVVGRTYNSSTSGPLYEHYVGTAAQVWIATTNATASLRLAGNNPVAPIERPAGSCGP